MKGHLGNNSRFVFDVFNPQVSFLAADPSARYERARYPDPHGGGEVVLEETREYIAERQVVRSTRYYHVGEKRDVSVSSLELRCFFPCELDLILEYFGFRLEAKYGDFDKSPLSSRSRNRFASVAVQPSGSPGSLALSIVSSVWHDSACRTRPAALDRPVGDAATSAAHLSFSQAPCPCP